MFVLSCSYCSTCCSIGWSFGSITRAPHTLPFHNFSCIPPRPDAGAPLVFNTAAAGDPVGQGQPNGDRLVGVVAYNKATEDCGRPTKPSAYTDMTKFRDWVIAQMDLVGELGVI